MANSFADHYVQFLIGNALFGRSKSSEYFALQILRSYIISSVKMFGVNLKLFKIDSNLINLYLKCGLLYMYVHYFELVILRSKSDHTASVITNEIYNRNKKDIYINSNIFQIFFTM